MWKISLKRKRDRHISTTKIYLHFWIFTIVQFIVGFIVGLAISRFEMQFIYGSEFTGMMSMFLGIGIVYGSLSIYLALRIFYDIKDKIDQLVNKLVNGVQPKNND